MAERNDSLNASQSAAAIPRGLELALCLTALTWAGAANAVASRSAQGLTIRFGLPSATGLAHALILFFLTVLGFRTLDWIATRGVYASAVLPLPARPTRAAEWGTGAALGWGLALAALLPLLLSMHLHAQIISTAGNSLVMVLGLLTLLVATLGQEVIFRGYPFQRLIRAIGPSWAAVLMSLIFAVQLVALNPPTHFVIALLSCTLLGILLSMAWLRTHALWLPWGAHFGYRAVMAVIFGLPIAGRGTFGSLTETFVSGPRWLTGGAFGLDAAVLTLPILLAGMAVLYRTTREYAWSYTHADILPAGYAVTVAPPAAHVAMEKAAAPPPLVQILPTTPQTRSTTDLTSH